MSTAAASATERLPIVVEMGAIGGAHLAEPGAALLQDVGNAERPADLDQLASRDQHLAARRQRAEREQQGARGVVHSQRVLGPGHGAKRARGSDRSGCPVPRCPGRTRGCCTRSRPPPSRPPPHGASGARPRLVWSTTPVALRTGRRLRREPVGEALANVGCPALGGAGAPSAGRGERLAHCVHHRDARRGGEQLRISGSSRSRSTEGSAAAAVAHWDGVGFGLAGAGFVGARLRGCGLGGGGGCLLRPGRVSALPQRIRGGRRIARRRLGNHQRADHVAGDAGDVSDTADLHRVSGPGAPGRCGAEHQLVW